MIKIQDMDFCYGKKTLFEDLHLSIQAGKIYGLLGLNGAGKSTLMKLLCGLLFPKQGMIQVFDCTPAQRSPAMLSKLFMLSEEIHMPAISGQNYLTTHAPFYPQFDWTAFKYYSTALELPSLNQRLHRFSYGQKKKFLLAFGLASKTELLLLDEPTNGLDIPSKSIFRRLLIEASSSKRSFIISTHQVRDINALVDSVCIVHQGKIIFNHSMEEIETQFHMKHSKAQPILESPGLLYSEATIDGYWSIWQGQSPESNLMDLEILFNTVLTNEKR